MLKKKIIDLTIFLLEIAKTTPIFSVDFDIIADNKDIEDYLLSKVDETDFEGKKLTEQEICENRNNALTRFHESNGYNKDGQSKFTMRKVFTMSSIDVNTVRELVCGEADNMPNNYTFYGEFVRNNCYE